MHWVLVQHAILLFCLPNSLLSNCYGPFTGTVYTSAYNTHTLPADVATATPPIITEVYAYRAAQRTKWPSLPQVHSMNIITHLPLPLPIDFTEFFQLCGAKEIIIKVGHVTQRRAYMQLAALRPTSSTNKPHTNMQW